MCLAVLYEHPDWFVPLFAALERRAIPVLHMDATSLRWDPAEPPVFSLLLNRMSPSAHTRGHGPAIYAAAAFISWVEAHGVPVINGSGAYRLELSKSAQLDLLGRLNLPFPRARVVNNSLEAPAAAQGFRFPVIVKPNVGGSGAGILRFDSHAELADAAGRGAIDLGIDSTALVQEFLPARDGTITRLEFLGGELLYGIDITPPAGHGFNLCPADICQTGEAVPAPDLALCATRPAMTIAAAAPRADMVDAGRRIARAAGLDVCGIEYLVDERDGAPYVYDINALSNFVTDAPRIVGFDPFERFAAYIAARLERAAAKVPSAADAG
jgi:D-alanine-D-alanine ligase-like ATP-grasp enzyme